MTQIYQNTSSNLCFQVLKDFKRLVFIPYLNMKHDTNIPKYLLKPIWKLFSYVGFLHCKCNYVTLFGWIAGWKMSQVNNFIHWSIVIKSSLWPWWMWVGQRMSPLNHGCLLYVNEAIKAPWIEALFTSHVSHNECISTPRGLSHSLLSLQVTRTWRWARSPSAWASPTPAPCPCCCTTSTSCQAMPCRPRSTTRSRSESSRVSWSYSNKGWSS